jgi:hypothetical protein
MFLTNVRSVSVSEEVEESMQHQCRRTNSQLKHPCDSMQKWLSRPGNWSVALRWRLTNSTVAEYLSRHIQA